MNATVNPTMYLNSLNALRARLQKNISRVENNLAELKLQLSGVEHQIKIWEEENTKKEPKK